MRRVILSIVSVAFAVAMAVPISAPAAGTSATGVTSAAASDLFPARIALPNGWRPEGIAIGEGATFFVGSLADGAILRGDLATGKSRVLVPGTAGTMAVGLEIDQHDRIWTATGGGGGAVVYDARTGRKLAAFQFTAPGATFVNDAVATPNAVYFTDSMRPFLYVVPLGRDGRLPDPSTVRALPLAGGAADTAGFNNGIEATPDGRLLVGQTQSGKLFEVSPRTGDSREVDLGGASLINADGIIRRGHTLYVVQNASNQVAVVRFDSSFTSGTVVRTITDPALDVPSTAGLFGPFLYAVNARFSTPPTPATTYDAIRLPA
jgi:sugar lactone lactonase YvrE